MVTMLRSCLLFMLISGAFAAQDLQPYTRCWIGTIGPWDARLTLEISATRIRGRLRSNGVPGPLQVEGPCAKDGRIDCLVSDAKDQPIGQLSGRFGEDRGFVGRFKPADHGPELAVTTAEAAEFLRTETLQGPWYRLVTNQPVFIDSIPLLAKLNGIVPGELTRLNTDFLGVAADRRNAIAPMRLDCDVEIFHVSPALVSILITQYAFTGGAHGTTDYVPGIWAWLDGAPFRLDLPDLFTNPDAALTEIALYCAEDLAKQGASEAAQITTKPAGFFHNIAVSRNGLHVFFAPYSVGSYDEGAFAVTVPWPRLMKCLDAHGPLAELLPAETTPAPDKPARAKPRTGEVPVTLPAVEPAGNETVPPSDEPKPKSKRKQKPAVQP